VSVLGAGVPGDPVADELAALRRVAALVAGGAPPEEVFAAVVAEIGRVFATADGRSQREVLMFLSS